MSQQIVEGVSDICPTDVFFCYFFAFLQKLSHYLGFDYQTDIVSFIKLHSLGRLEEVNHHLCDLFSHERDGPFENVHEIRK